MPMATAYLSEAHEVQHLGKSILVENLTPSFRPEERNPVKQSIEDQLYDIFCKYTQSTS